MSLHQPVASQIGGNGRHVAPTDRRANMMRLVLVAQKQPHAGASGLRDVHEEQRVSGLGLEASHRMSEISFSLPNTVHVSRS
jgi:hypothetical protein